MKKHDKRRQTKKHASADRGGPEVSVDPSWKLSRRHMRIGWWSLLVFISLGLGLEAMHGFKVQWYVGEDTSTRRLMWTLAHAHGTLLSLIHIGYAAAMNMVGTTSLRFRGLSSWCLCLAGILLPGGFFAGGVTIYDGDPGLGVLLVPVGGGLLLIAVLVTALSVEACKRPPVGSANDPAADGPN